METELVLVVMLPENDRVMLIQTPRLRTIAELEDFIVDEYSRVFPFALPLSRNLRIQKCVSPELVVDRRSYAETRQHAPHSFVDLAKNVQAGNVFQNMEQIYIVLNENVWKQQVPQKLPISAPTVQKESAAEKKKTKQAMKKLANKTQKQQALKTITAATSDMQAEKSVESNKTAEKEVQEGEKEKEEQVLKKASVETKPQNTKQTSTCDATKDAAEEFQDRKNDSNDAKKVDAAATDKKKIDRKEKSKKAAKMEKHDAKMAAKKENESDSKTPVAATEENTSKNILKKVASNKSENVLLKKMREAKRDAAQSRAAVVVGSFHDTESDTPKVLLKNERKRKSNEEDVSGAQANTAPEFLEPVTKKKKTVKKSNDKITKPIEDGVAASMIEMSSKKTAMQDKIPKTSKKKPTTILKSELKTDDDSSTASESSSTKSKSKKNIGIKSDDVEEPVMKRAKTKATSKASIVKKANEKVKRAAKPTTPTSDTSACASSSSQSSSSSASQEEKLASVEEIDVVETPSTKKATMVMLNEEPKVISKQKSGFEKILAEKMKQIADEKKAPNAKLPKTFTPERGSMQTSKSAKSTASESSSDSDQPPDFVKVAKHSRKNATPVEDSSSSSSEEEKMDYSQCLLADLTKNDIDEEVVPVVLKKGKKSKQSDSTLQTSQSMEEDMPSSQLTQKCVSHLTAAQESNSVLLPSLSRNRFSLGSMPVAKLKKSSKNPFSSPKKVKVKGKTSNATDRPNGRPRK